MAKAKPQTRTVSNPKAHGCWRDAPPMAQPRHDFALLLLPDGGVLAHGGSVYWERGEKRVTTSELRDPESGLWRTIPEPMAIELARGGKASQLMKATPPWNSRWSDDKLDQYTYERSASVRVVLGDWVLIAGGYQSTDNMGPFEGTDDDELSTVLYQWKNNPRWRYAGRMSSPHVGAAAVKLPDGRVIVAGGHPVRTSRSLASVEIWEPI